MHESRSFQLVRRRAWLWLLLFGAGCHVEAGAAAYGGDASPMADINDDSPVGRYDSATDSSVEDAAGWDTSLGDVSVGDAQPEDAPAGDNPSVDVSVVDTPLIDSSRPDWRPPPDGPEHGWALVPIPDVTTPTMAWFVEAPSDPNIILAGADGVPTSQHHFFRSTDGGSTWTRLHESHSLQYRPSFAPSDANIVYGIGIGGSRSWPDVTTLTVVRSLDGGLTWQARGAPSSGMVPMAPISVDPQNPAKIYVARKIPSNEIVVSTSMDSGVTWVDSAPVASDTTVLHGWSIAVDPVDALRLYIHVVDERYDCALLTSSNVGSSWQTLHQGLCPSTVGAFQSMARTFAIAPSDPSALYLLAPMVQEPGDAVTALTSHLCRSADRGATWSCRPLPTAPGPVGQVYSLIGVDAKDPHTVFIANMASWIAPATLYRSTNDGASWTSIVQFETQPTTELPDAALVSPSVAGRILVAKNGIERSTDGGATFSPVKPQVSQYGGRRVILARDDDRVLWLGSWRPDVYLTRDGATSWSTLGPFSDAHAFDIPNGPAISYPGRPNALFWWEASEESADTSGTLTIINPSSTGLVQNSVDGGRTIPDPLLSCAIGVDAPATRYCCTAHGLYRSMDSGQHWSPTGETAQCQKPFVDPSSSQIVYVTLPAVLRRSDNGGASFLDATPTSVCDGSACARTIEDVLFDETNPTHVYAHVTEYLDVDRFSRTYQESFDRGTSWRQVPSDLTRQRLYLDPLDGNVLYAAGKGGVRKSRDGGVSWLDVSRGLDHYDVCGLLVSRQTPGLAYASVCTNSDALNPPSEPHGLYHTVTGGE